MLELRTRRSVEERAQEIGQSTGVPLPFGVLGNWEAGDCLAIEAQVHRQLAQYRVSKRREFFRAPLAIIVGVIDEAVKRTRATPTPGPGPDAHRASA